MELEPGPPWTAPTTDRELLQKYLQFQETQDDHDDRDDVFLERLYDPFPRVPALATASAPARRLWTGHAGRLHELTWATPRTLVWRVGSAIRAVLAYDSTVYHADFVCFADLASTTDPDAAWAIAIVRAREAAIIPVTSGAPYAIAMPCIALAVVPLPLALGGGLLILPSPSTHDHDADLHPILAITHHPLAAPYQVALDTGGADALFDTLPFAVAPSDAVIPVTALGKPADHLLVRRAGAPPILYRITTRGAVTDAHMPKADTWRGGSQDPHARSAPHLRTADAAGSPSFNTQSPASGHGTVLSAGHFGESTVYVAAASARYARVAAVRVAQATASARTVHAAYAVHDADGNDRIALVAHDSVKLVDAMSLATVAKTTHVVAAHAVMSGTRRVLLVVRKDGRVEAWDGARTVVPAPVAVAGIHAAHGDTVWVETTDGAVVAARIVVRAWDRGEVPDANVLRMSARQHLDAVLAEVLGPTQLAAIPTPDDLASTLLAHHSEMVPAVTTALFWLLEDWSLSIVHAHPRRALASVLADLSARLGWSRHLAAVLVHFPDLPVPTAVTAPQINEPDPVPDLLHDLVATVFSRNPRARTTPPVPARVLPRVAWGRRIIATLSGSLTTARTLAALTPIPTIERNLPWAWPILVALARSAHTTARTAPSAPTPPPTPIPLFPAPLRRAGAPAFLDATSRLLTIPTPVTLTGPPLTHAPPVTPTAPVNDDPERTEAAKRAARAAHEAYAAAVPLHLAERTRVVTDVVRRYLAVPLARAMVTAGTQEPDLAALAASGVRNTGVFVVAAAAAAATAADEEDVMTVVVPYPDNESLAITIDAKIVAEAAGDDDVPTTGTATVAIPRACAPHVTAAQFHSGAGAALAAASPVDFATALARARTCAPGPVMGGYILASGLLGHLRGADRVATVRTIRDASHPLVIAGYLVALAASNARDAKARHALGVYFPAAVGLPKDLDPTADAGVHVGAVLAMGMVTRWQVHDVALDAMVEVIESWSERDARVVHAASVGLAMALDAPNAHAKERVVARLVKIVREKAGTTAAMAAIAALGLIARGTGDPVAVAACRLPTVGAAAVAPDEAMHRVIATRWLTEWEAMDTSSEGVEKYARLVEGDDGVRAMVAAGACHALGVRYAGTENERAVETCLEWTDWATSVAARSGDGSLAARIAAHAAHHAVHTILVAASLIAAGSAHPRIYARVAHLHARLGPNVPDAHHTASNLALGFLLLAQGRLRPDADPVAVAAAAFPQYADDEVHFLMRHLWVRAACPADVVVRDAEAPHEVVPVSATVSWDDGRDPAVVAMPGVINDVARVAHVAIGTRWRDGVAPVEFAGAPPPTVYVHRKPDPAAELARALAVPLRRLAAAARAVLDPADARMLRAIRAAGARLPAEAAVEVARVFVAARHTAASVSVAVPWGAPTWIDVWRELDVDARRAAAVVVLLGVGGGDAAVAAGTRTAEDVARVGGSGLDAGVAQMLAELLEPGGP
ncbi:Anaphase-promoting complex subunit 1 [Allomyces javanicus]|nr:Anaphase-promoting complex subunit 1 [Allomyces javanicus]